MELVDVPAVSIARPCRVRGGGGGRLVRRCRTAAPPAQVMRKKITRKILDMLKRLAVEEPERYLRFYKEYSNAIKFGVIEDMAYGLRGFPSPRRLGVGGC